MNRVAPLLPLCFALACSSRPLDSSGSEENPPPSGSSITPAPEPSPTFNAYPAGPYGTGVGATIDNLSFLGWHDPVKADYDPSKLEVVALSDFYDPNGEKGIKLLAINVSAVWCAVCRAEYEDFLANSTFATYSQKGVMMLGTLFEDNNYYPARPSDLQLWGSVRSHQVAFPLALDPSFKMGAYFTSDATPLNMIVDARTMKIVDTQMGYSATYWQGVDALLAKL